MTKDRKLNGVGGWLGFFIFSLIITLLLNLYISFDDINSSIGYLGTISLILLFIYYIGSIGYNAYAIYVLTSKKNNAVSVAKMFLVLMFASNFIGILFSTLTNTDLTPGPRNLLYCLIWFLYLTYSKRVINTYPIKSRITKCFDEITFFIILALSVVVSLLAFSVDVAHAFNNDIQIASPIALPDRLIGKYSVYRPFINSSLQKEVKLEFDSDTPLNAYFVPSETDWENFKFGKEFNTYTGCSFKNQRLGLIDCNVTSGGVIIENPTLETATYVIK